MSALASVQVTTVGELLALDSTRLNRLVAREGIQVCRWTDLSAEERATCERFYQDRVFPVLTPLAVDPAHPFPYVSNLSFSIAAMIRDEMTGEERFARVKVPTLFPRLYEIPGTTRFIPVEDIIVAQLGTLFPGMPGFTPKP